MNNYLILVATEDEKNALIPSKLHDKVILIGMGYRNVIKNITLALKKDSSLIDKCFINIGYCGSDNGKIGSIYEVEYSENAGKNIYYDLTNEREFLKLETHTNLDKANCFTAFDFVVNVDTGAQDFKLGKNNTIIYDMELAAICAFNPNTIAYKIVSDNLEKSIYESSLKSSYVEDIEKILKNIINYSKD